MRCHGILISHLSSLHFQVIYATYYNTSRATAERKLQTPTLILPPFLDSSLTLPIPVFQTEYNAGIMFHFYCYSQSSTRYTRIFMRYFTYLKFTSQRKCWFWTRYHKIQFRTRRIIINYKQIISNRNVYLTVLTLPWRPLAIESKAHRSLIALAIKFLPRRHVSKILRRFEQRPSFSLFSATDT